MTGVFTIELPVRKEARAVAAGTASCNLRSMNLAQIKELYYAEPFMPFDLILPNGTALRVAHPEFISFAPDRRTIHLWEPTAGGKRVDSKMIVAVQEAPSKPAKRKR